MSCKCSPGSDAANGRVDYQYAVKFVCGEIKPAGHGGSGDNPLPVGQYFTKINIHNSSRCDCVTFRWKVAVGFPHLKIGPISSFAEVTLCQDEALEIACRDIFARLGGHLPEGLEGWVVIESPSNALDVVAVYGTAASVGGPVNAFHTERVHPRCLPVCEDFHLDASTGVSRWEVAGPFPGPAPAGASFAPATLGSLDPVAPHAPIDPNWSSLPGALWIHPPGNNVQPEGVYTYRLMFKLCSGFRNPSLDGRMVADYFANATLNGHPISAPQTGGPNYSTPIALAATSHFKAGLNELVVLVTNREKSTTGLALHAEINVENGLCAGDSGPLLKCPGVCYDVFTRHFILGHSGHDWWGQAGPVCNGAMAGTRGERRRIEALTISLSGNVPPGTTIEYQVHQQNLGWLPSPTTWCQAGGIAGDPHHFPLPLRLEAVKIRLVNAPLNCRVRYMVHTANKWGQGGGDGPWVYDGQQAGTTGQNRRMEALWVVIE